MSSVPNTHAAVFTAIPDSITKTWRPETLDVKSSKITDGRGKLHEMSVIQEVSLLVKFNDQISAASSLLDRSTDNEFDRIGIWQEARKDWAALEKAIEDTVQSFIKRSRERSATTKVDSIDVLTSVLTRTSLDDPSATLPPIEYSRQIHKQDNSRAMINTDPPTQGYAETVASILERYPIEQDPKLVGLNDEDVYADPWHRSHRGRPHTFAVTRKRSKSKKNKARGIMKVLI